MSSNQHASTYDFIVIGDGSAGAIVTTRLNPKYKAHLVEAVPKSGLNNHTYSLPHGKLLEGFNAINGLVHVGHAIRL